MNYRRFGRTEWQVSEIGYGMWGMAGWTESSDNQSNRSLDKAVELGCNFFDTAWGYGEGKSEQILSSLVSRHKNKTLYMATKVPPANWEWPPIKGSKISEVFPSKHIVEYTEKSLSNLGTDCMDLLQFHVWEDDWAETEEWQRTIEDLKQQGKIRAFGLSLNRWEPGNGIKAVKTGMVDSIQAIYNIFDQAPEDELFPALEEHDVAFIARVPFDEGTLTGTLTKETTWPEGDWRNTYFVPENLHSSVEHADELKLHVPLGMTMPQMALKFITANKHVCTTIPGMRKMNHVESNLATSDMSDLSESLLQELKEHRWDREPTEWSQ